MARIPSARQRYALAALAIVGIGTFTLLESGSEVSDVLGELNRSRRRQYGAALRGLSSYLPKKYNLNFPYGPYEGEIEPPEDQDRRQLRLWDQDNVTGEVNCTVARILSAEEIEATSPTSGVTYQNTIVVGYPGADKRLVMRQMEAMTSLSGRDAWDFKFLGMTNQPFIKTNYPHHEGIWGWEDHGDQVVLVVRNIRHTIDEYHDILADIHYAKTWSEATENIPRLYKGEIIDDYYTRWRDERTMDEIGWYGWLIDYWMEGGILRDYFDHKLTTKEHWAKLRAPETFTYGELQWDVNICSTDPLPGISYDDLCDPAVTADCKAKLIISADRLMSAEHGRAEHRKIAMLMNETAGVRDELVNDTAWGCFYDLMIGENPNGTAPLNTDGYDDYRVRQGVETRKHVVSTRHLNKMVQQLTRLINKYSAFDPETGFDWANHEQAQYLVEILTEHRTEVQAELAATAVEQMWAHPPKPNWVVFPKCGPESRRVWDYDYPHEFSGYVLDMFPELVA